MKAKVWDLRKDGEGQTIKFAHEQPNKTRVKGNDNTNIFVSLLFEKKKKTGHFTLLEQVKVG